MEERVTEVHGDDSATAASARIHGLDALRGVLMMLGVVLHCALAYIPDSSWPFMDWTASSWNLKLITLGVHMFRMPAFFLLSGFFGALLWQRRGARAMLKNRVERIVLPFAVFVMVLYPLVGFCFTFGGGVLDDTAVPIQAALNEVMTLPFLPEGTMHLWFLYDLIFVTAIGAAFVAGMGRLGLSWPRLLNGVRRMVECPWRFVVILGGLNFVWCAAFEWTDIPTEGEWVPERLEIILYYLLWYGVGWMVYASNAMLSKCQDRAWTLVCIGVANTVMQFAVRGHLEGPSTADTELASAAQGGSAQPEQDLFAVIGELVGGLPPADSGLWELGGALTTSVGLVAFTRGFMGLFLRYAGSGKPIWRYLSDSSYWVYLLHLPFTVLIPCLLLGWQAPVFIKYPTSVLLVLGLCWLSYDCLVRPTAVGLFLNGRRYPARHRRLSTVGTLLAVGWLGTAMVFYPPPLERPPPWRNGLAPSELLPGETVVFPVQAVAQAPEGVTLDRCVGVQGYMLCTDKASPEQMAPACAALGASVAQFKTKDEQDRINRLASKLTRSPFWVAVTDVEYEGWWRWPDGTVLSRRADVGDAPWHDNEPNNWGGNEHCAALNWHGAAKWNDLPCDNRLGFICEQPAVEP